jgi:2-polyprenyl-3-methyl-5-hydroxy-6-metoxy-1,4-benzoquinol methylase
VFKQLFIKVGGWRAPVFFGGAADVDRWLWVARRALPGPIRTLDAGSGLGALSFHAAHAGNKVVAISFVARNNEKARERAQALGLHDVEFLDGDLRELDRVPASLGLFDQIYCIEVIEHLKDDRKLLRDLAALLKPGGRILLSAPYKFHRQISGEKISEIEDGGHVRFGYTVEELVRLFRENDMRVESAELITGLVCQKIDNVFRSISRWTNRDVGWLVSFPLRIFQVFDKPLTKLTAWPPLSVAVVAVKPTSPANRIGHDGHFDSSRNQEVRQAG